MSIYDDECAKALKIWEKHRKQGWLEEHLKGNAKGKIASKRAFLAGYVCAIVDNIEVITKAKEHYK